MTTLTTNIMRDDTDKVCICLIFNRHLFSYNPFIVSATMPINLMMHDKEHLAESNVSSAGKRSLSKWLYLDELTC